MEMNAKSVLLFIDINSEILKLIRMGVKDERYESTKLICELLPIYQEFIGSSEEKIIENRTVIKLEDAVRSFYKASLISRHRYQKIIGQITNFKLSMNLD